MLRWDVFCRVIDNHGDLGVCWRLCRALVALGDRVRLHVDDAAALAWMAPQPVVGIEVLPFFSDDVGDRGESDVGDAVVEAFGCDLPAAYVRRMRRGKQAPVWINLEYLSAESYVERSHGLASPQSDGPGAGLVKWFYYPGFNVRTGGLLRAGTSVRHADPAPRPSGKPRVVGVFAYASADFDALLRALATEPTVIQVAQGPSLTALQHFFAEGGAAGHPWLRWQALPWMPQTDFDRWLAQCDLLVVRGEDSLVSAIWAGRPFIWNIYPQDDLAHVAKLHALLDTMLAGVTLDVAAPIRQLWLGLNAVGGAGDDDLPAIDAALLSSWAHALRPWHQALQSQPDLATQLRHFVLARR